MTFAQQLRQEGLQQGLEGEHRKAFSIAKNLRNMGADKDFIKKATGLSDQELIHPNDA